MGDDSVGAPRRPTLVLLDGHEQLGPLARALFLARTAFASAVIVTVHRSFATHAGNLREVLFDLHDRAQREALDHANRAKSVQIGPGPPPRDDAHATTRASCFLQGAREKVDKLVAVDPHHE